MANLYFEATLDAEKLKEELRTTGERVKNFGKEAETEGGKVQKSFDGIGAAAKKGGSEISQNIAIQKKVIADLQKELIPLEAAFKKANFSTHDPKALAERKRLSGLVKQMKADLEGEQKALTMLEQRSEGAAKGMVSLRTQMMNTRNEMGALKLAGRENTAEYKKLEDQLGTLGTAYRELRTVEQAVSTGGTQLAGFMNGLNALSGAIATGAGALSLFNNDSEKMAEIQTRLQGIMAMSIGLMQVSNALHSTSAFRITTVNKVKEIWAATNLKVATTLGISNTAAKALMGTLTLGLSAAITVAIYAFNKFSERQKKAAKEAKFFADINSQVASSLKHESAMLDMYRGKLLNAQPGSTERVRLVKELNKLYPDLLKNIDAENASVATLTTTMDGYVSRLEKSMRLKVLEEELSNLLTESQTAQSDARSGKIDANELYRKEQDIAKRRTVLIGELEYQKDLVDYGKEVADLMKERRALQKEASELESFGGITQDIPELKSEYESLLNEIASINKQIEEGIKKSGKGGLSGFNIDDYKKTLSDQKSAYEDYNAALRNARSEDKQEVENYYKGLTKQGEDYEAYLKNQLEEFRNNTEAKVAIYQAAASANILLEEDRPSKIKGARVSKLKVEPLKIDERDIAKLEAAVARSKVIYDNILAADRVAANIKLSEELIDSAYAASEVARAISEIDADLGSAFQKMADLMGGIGNVVGTMNDANASSFQKVSGIVSLAITAGGELAKIRSGWMNEEVNQQRDINEALANQLTLEAAINDLRRERAQQEVYSSAFLDPTFADQYRLGLDKAKDSQDLLNSSLGNLMNNAVFTARGKAKRRLFGSKSDDYSFSMKQLLGDYKTAYAGEGIADLFLGQHNQIQNGIGAFIGGMLDPLGIFGGYADTKAQGNALDKLRNAFRDTLASMGKTSADMAKMSSTEWVDFFSLMDEMGYITDESTKRMVESAKKAAEEYEKAMEEMRGVISDVAGDLGKSLNDTLVKAFKSGEDAALSFQDVVNDVLQSLFMSEIITPYFRGYFDQLQSEMEQSMDGGDRRWMDDILRFSDNIGGAFDGALGMMSDFDKAMQDAGFKGFTGGGAADSSLTGAIKGVSEQTASLIAGQMNAIRINQAESLKAINDVARYSAQIALNTAYNKHLVSIDAKLDYLKSDPLKAKGL